MGLPEKDWEGERGMDDIQDTLDVSRTIGSMKGWLFAFSHLVLECSKP